MELIYGQSLSGFQNLDFPTGFDMMCLLISSFHLDTSIQSGRLNLFEMKNSLYAISIPFASGKESIDGENPHKTYILVGRFAFDVSTSKSDFV